MLLQQTVAELIWNVYFKELEKKDLNFLGLLVYQTSQLSNMF